MLIDKQKQTLTVYQNGTVIDTLLVSTGRAEKNNLDQETAAGCFLTGYHRVNFSMNGKKYDYVIQYDGGNLLHQTPYDWGQHKKDFTLGRGYLGAKASHACIRIQPEPGEGGLNAYWLFTHIPYHTRVMILDDQAEREATAEKLKRTDKDSADIRKLNLTDTYTDSTDLNVEITFGGCVFPGGTKSFNARKESFASAVREKGYGFALNELAEIFRSDDFTCVNLCTAILNESAAAPDNKGILFAKSGTEHLFDDASVEMIQITEDRTIPSEGNLRNDTEEILRTFLQVLTSDRTVTCTLKGHLFGFAGCSESEYLKDPSIIDRSLAELEQAGCEKKIVLLSWPEENNPSHSVTQEAMAHRAVRSGADIVIGNSPGTVQGIDYIENVPVVYSLGDLLNGSTGVKPKNQQGMLVRALFGFENGHDDVTVRVIPIMPYGNGDSKQNEYTPSAGLSGQQTETLIGRIWKDSAEAALARVIFYMKDQ